MGRVSEEDVVLSALTRLLNGKPVGEQEFVFYDNNDALEGLGLTEKVKPRMFKDALKHLNGSKKIRVVTSGGRTRVTIRNL